MLGLIIQTILTILQFGIILAAVGLEVFSEKSMGVSRYLTYKKTAFELTLFTSSLIHLYLLIFIIGGILCLILWVLNIKMNKKKLMVPVIIAVIANIGGVVFLLIPVNLSAYYFFLIAIMLFVAIQYIKVTCLLISKPNADINR